MTITCGACNEAKPTMEFSPANKARVSLSPTARSRWGWRCKSCAAEYARTQYNTRPEVAARQRAYRLEVKYGMSETDYQALLAAQGGTCAVCSGPPNGKHSMYVVDHDHVSGRVRGLLCSTCNVAIGLAGDDAQLLRDMAHYLEQV